MPKNANDTTPCTEHDWTPDPWTPSMEVCDCGATREAPEVEPDDVRVVCVAVEARRAA